MADKLVPISLPPGLFKNGTLHQAQGRWYDANLVRFFDGTIRPVGGWRRLQDGSAAPKDFVALSGIVRAALAYRTDLGGIVQVFATTTHLYAIAGGVLHDITPAGFVAGLPDSHSPTGLGNYSNGPYGTGFYGTGSQTSALVDADTWQLTSFGNYCLAVCTSDGKLYQWTGDPAVLPAAPLSGPPSSVTATAVASGGTFAAGTYYWKVTATGPLGETLGSAEVSTAIALNGSCNLAWTNPAGTTSVRVFRGTASGQENVYFSLGAVSAFTDTGAAGTSGTVPTTTAPSRAAGVVVTPERFVFALGAGNNARLVQWPSQETASDWNPTALNTAGNFPLVTNGRIVCGAAAKGQTLIWTDADLHSATYIGGAFLYRFDRIGENCGILAPNAKALAAGQVFWMGRNGFFRFDGFAQPIACDVQDYVFGDFNYAQSAKCWAMSFSEFNEVWFFYPSAGSSEIDRYCAYNYVEQHWTVGKLRRTAGFDIGSVSNPVLVDQLGFIYEHDLLDSKLQAKITTVPRTANGTTIANNVMLANGELARTTEAPYLESGPFELGDGDRLMRVQRLLPDAKIVGDLSLTMYGANDQTSPEQVYGPYNLAQPTPLQITARQVRFRIAELVQEGWRVGVFKLGIRESSRR